MALFVERPVDGLACGPAWVLFDLCLGREAVRDVIAQVIGITGCVCDDVANALQTFDQGARLGAIAPVAGRDCEPDRQAQGIDSGVDLRCQAASGTANTGSFKPPF